MTERTPLDEMTSDQLDQLYDEIDRLRAGEEPGANPLTELTPGQWIARWNQATPTTRLQIVEAGIANAAAASRCLMLDHEGRLEGERHAWVAVARVRDVIADMEGITGARHWARILRKVIDGDEPQPEEPAAQPAPAATQAIDDACPVKHCDPEHCGADMGGGCAWRADPTMDRHDRRAQPPATITDPEYLRQQYTAIIGALHDNRPDHIAAELLRVHGRHLAQLRQRLRLADELLATRDAELAAAKKTARGIGAWGVLQAIEQALPQGPTVAEAAADDARWWNGEKAGE